MITAVDSNVLLDVFSGDDRHGPASREALASCIDDGRAVLCEVVWAEVCGVFGDSGQAESILRRVGLGFDPMTATAASTAGRAWRRHRQVGGPRTRVIADFLIGAHAATAADRLLTRDRGFYRRYFAELEVVDPSAA